jgi:transcription antitermination protein NusB
MLGRRSLRIKTMQLLYGYELNKDLSIGSLESQLIKSMNKTATLYLSLLAYLNEICQYSMVDAGIKLAKYIKSEDDNKVNTQIANTDLLKNIFEHDEFSFWLKKEKINSYLDKDLPKSLFMILRDKPKYKDFCKIAEPTIEEQNDMLSYIVKKIMAGNKSMEDTLEESFSNFDDDGFLLFHLIQKYIDGAKDASANVFVEAVKTWEEEQRFPKELLKQYISHNDELLTLIQPNLQNWDIERIAVIDTVLMKMAVCELLYMPTVPVKVSINEYIDISKIYSTPKSKDFVNGVLDKTKQQLQEAGLIKKQGRGLMQ